MATNESEYEIVKMGVRGFSSGNISSKPHDEFVTLTRQPVKIKVDLSIENALHPSTVSIAFILVEPVESLGSNVLTIDYEEIWAGIAMDGIPVFEQQGLKATKSLRP